MARWLNKAQIKELLDSLNVHYDNSDSYRDLKHRLIYDELPRYYGKTKYRDVKRYIDREIIPQRIQNIADDLEIFTSYQPSQQSTPFLPSALTVKDNIIKRVNAHQNFDVDFGDSDDNGTRESYLLGLILSLKDLHPRYQNNYLVLRLKYGDDKEVMRVINSYTLGHIQNLIDVLQGKIPDDVPDYTDSDQAVLFGLIALQGFSLEWYDYDFNFKAFGYFPYYNTVPELDLSVFGIYHNDNEADYTNNCFIHAAICSGIFTDEEITFMKSLINTRYIHRDDLKYIANTLSVHIVTYYYCSKRNKIDKAVKFGNSSNRVLRLLIRCGHCMLYKDELVPENKYGVKNLNTLISRMLQNDELALIHNMSKAEKFIEFNDTFDKLEYAESSCRKYIPSEKKLTNFELVFACVYNSSTDSLEYVFKNEIKSMKIYDLIQNLKNKSVLIYMPDLSGIKDSLNIFDSVKISDYRNTTQYIRIIKDNKVILLRNFHSLTSIDTKGMNALQFHETVLYVKNQLMNKLNININDYSSLPNIALAAAYKNKCFDNVYTMTGLPKYFAQKCIYGGLIRTLYDNCFEVDDVTCFDINSSYGTSMNMMKGIPTGRPKPFYKSIPQNACYAFIQIKISNIRNDVLGRYKFVREGIMFVDSVMYNEIVKYVDCDIEVINGYYFDEGFNNNINSFSKVLYELRKDEKLNKLGKNMLSSLYGKSLQSAQQFKTKLVPKSKLNMFIAEYGNFIYSMNEIKKSDTVNVKLMKSLNLNYNMPQFGVQVLSESRKRINDIINYCVEQNLLIYSIKTDSFTISNNDINEFTKKCIIGNELGQFKIEYQANHVKYTSASCYKAELVDSTLRTRGKVK